MSADTSETPSAIPDAETEAHSRSMPAEPVRPGETILEWGARSLVRALSNYRKPHVIVGAAIVLIAAGLRLWDLDTRALHHDEAQHAYYSWALSEGGGYMHNPLLHGTFQFIGMGVVFGLFGASDASARLLPALAGIVVVALPLVLFRRELGEWGAAITSLLLAVSPGMLYFSRFARNDVYMVLWTLLIAWTLWRFLEAPKPRYLYAASGVLAVAFATKELTYLVALVFVIYLFFRVTRDLHHGAEPDETAKPGWRRRVRTDFMRLLRGLKRLKGTPATAWPPAVGFLVLLLSFAIPLSGAAAGWFQDRIGLVLTNPDPRTAGAGGFSSLDGPVGAPISNGPGFGSRLFDGLANVSGVQISNPSALESPDAPVQSVFGVAIQAFDVAAILVLVLLGVGCALGIAWGGRRWLVAAGIFWGAFVFLFTTAFNNWIGLASGIWQSLGYWLAQQDVARGDQPWYYYPTVLGTYEYLPLLAGTISGAYLVWRRDLFGVFVSCWFLLTLAFQTYAGEKMPWLSIHLTLPLILLSGRGLGILALHTWRKRGVFTQRQGLLRWTAIAGVALLGVATVQSATRVSFANGDIPVELLVYTQTSPSLAKAVEEIDRLAVETGLGDQLPIMIDTTGGLGWPFYWYLRDFKAVEYRCLGDSGSCGVSAEPLSSTPPAGQVVVVHGDNEHVASSYLQQGYNAGARVPFRQWFPEVAYRGQHRVRGLTITDIAGGAFDLGAWASIWDYWRERELPMEIGKIDVVVYFPEGFDAAPLTSAAPGGPPPARG